MMRVNRTYWVSAMGLAEAVGIAVVATACAAVDRGLVGAGLAGRDGPLWQVAVPGAASGAVARVCVAGTTWAAIRRAGR